MKKLKQLIIKMFRKIIIILLATFFTQMAKGQELWQLQPYAVDSNYVLGAMSTGEPTWVHKDSLGISGGSGTVKGTGLTNTVAYWASSDSLTNDSLFSYLPSSDRVGIGTTTPTGLGVGLHLNGGTFTDFHLTNPTTGTTSSDGTSLFINSLDAYLTNREAGDITLATQNIERIKINETGTVNVASLDTDNAAPTTSGTTRKVISDANGLLSFKTDTDGTVTSVGLITGTSGTDVNVSGSPVTSSGNITLNIPTASASNTGKLSSTDWSTFNGKLGSLNGLTASTQTFAVSTASAGFGITSSTSTHTFNLPFAESASGLRLGHNSDVVANGVSVGNNAGDTDCSNCVALGKDVLSSSTTGASNNVGIGLQALFSNTDGIDNMAIGTYSNYYNQTGDYNVGIGTQSLQNNTTGNGNIAIGRQALMTNSTTENTSIGYFARRAGSGNYNTDIGSYAGEQASGSESVMIGYAAGRYNSGSNSVMIGEFAGSNNTTSNTLYIDNSSTASPLIGGNFSTNRVGINTAISSLARDLHVTGEMRVTDLTTDTPTSILGSDADGDLANMTVNNGVTVSAGAVGLTGQALALHNLASNGIIARTGAATVTNRTITAGDGIAVTNGDGVSGNPTITNVIASHGVLYNTGNLSSQTLDGTDREIDFTTAINSNMTSVNTTTNVIEVPATGTYEISYSGSYQVASTYVTNVYFKTYVNGVDYGYYGQCRTRNAENGVSNIVNFSRTYITTLTGGDDIELYYGDASITSTVSFFNIVLNVKRIK